MQLPSSMATAFLTRGAWLLDEPFELLRELARVTLVSEVLGGTVLLGVALIVTVAMRRAAASVRHRIWGMTLVALIVLPVLSLTLPSWRVPIIPVALMQATGSTTWQRDKPDGPEPRAVGLAMSRPQSESMNLLPQPVSGKSLVSHSGPSRDVASWIPQLSHELVVLWIWFSGAALMLIGVLIGGLRTRAISAQARLITDSGYRAIVEELGSRVRLRRAVRILEHADAVVPMTWGWVRPVILLPRQARVWKEELRRTVLLHELAHIQRGDVAFQLLGRVACSLCWFHPLAWWGLHKLRVERELACDDAVIQAGHRASDYAEQLLEVARICRRPNGLSLAVEINRGGSLEPRIRALFDTGRSHSPLSCSLAMLLLIAVVLLAGGVAVFRPMISQSLPVASAAATYNSGLVKGPLVQRVWVIDGQGRPVVGAKLTQLGFGTSTGSGMAWLKDWPKDFETDAEGMAVIAVPEVSEVHAQGHGGIVNLQFAVKHSTHPLKQVRSRLLRHTGPIMLDDPLPVRIRAFPEGDDEPLTADVFLHTSGEDTPLWTLVDGVLKADTLSPIDSDGGRFLRVIHAPAARPAWFSDLVDLKRHVDGGDTGQFDLTLYPGVRVEGKLADDVPRPVTKGTVSAAILDPTNYRHWHWADFVPLQADGTFVFESLPRECNLQLIAVCDGWVSLSPTVAEVSQYSQMHGLELVHPYTERNGIVTASLHRLSGTVCKPVLSMQRTASCELKVLTASGEPVEGVAIYFSPNQVWLNGGSTLIGAGWSDLERLRSKNTASGFNTSWEALSARYSGVTDRFGEAIVVGLPPGNMSFNVELEGYELVPDLTSAAMNAYSFRQGHVEVRPGETAQANITMRRKK